MLEFIFLVGVFITPLQATPLGQFSLHPACTGEQSQHCTNLTTAIQCQSTQHCIETVWKDSFFPPDNSDVCNLCIKGAKISQQLLFHEKHSISAKRSIKQIFRRNCQILSDQQSIYECNYFIDALIETLASPVHPLAVCSVSGFCNNQDIGNTPNHPVKELVRKVRSINANDDCKICNKVLSATQKTFMESNRHKKNSEQICSKLGSNINTCKSIAPTYFNNMYEYLGENLNATEFCAEIKGCYVIVDTISSNYDFILNGKPGNLPCDICKQIVGQIEDEILKDSKEYFHNLLVDTCKDQPTENECKTYVNIAYPLIYNHFKNKVSTSEALCHNICFPPRPAVFPIPTPMPTPNPTRIYAPRLVPYYQPTFNMPNFDLSGLLAPLGLAAGAAAGLALGGATGGLGLLGLGALAVG